MTWSLVRRRCGSELFIESLRLAGRTREHRVLPVARTTSSREPVRQLSTVVTPLGVRPSGRIADRVVVGAEVRRDDVRVVAHLARVCLRRSPRPASRQYTRSEIPMMSGMSCSITSIAAPSSRWMRTISGPNASASRCATPPVGSSSSSTRGVDREQRAELDDAARAGRQVRHELVGVAAEAEEVDRARRPRRACAAPAAGDGGSPVIDGTQPRALPGFERDHDRLAHGERRDTAGPPGSRGRARPGAGGTRAGR